VFGDLLDFGLELVTKHLGFGHKGRQIPRSILGLAKMRGDLSMRIGDLVFQGAPSFLGPVE
jgi:hypothetical protein